MKFKIDSLDFLFPLAAKKVDFMSRLTHTRKMKYFPIIVQRDSYKCFYCHGELTDNHPAEYDHLNDDLNDSRVENLVLCHHECNNKKKNSYDMQILAGDKLIQNEKTVLASERKLADTGRIEELTSSQSISQSLRPIALQWLEEHTIIDGSILLKDAVPAIVNLCQKQIGWGSQAAIRRYIEEWTNTYNGEFTLSKNESGKIIIRRRTEN